MHALHGLAHFFFFLILNQFTGCVLAAERAARARAHTMPLRSRPSHTRGRHTRGATPSRTVTYLLREVIPLKTKACVSRYTCCTQMYP